MDTLCIPGIKRLLVLNAASQGDSMDESVAAFKQKTRNMPSFQSSMRLPN